MNLAILPRLPLSAKTQALTPAPHENGRHRKVPDSADDRSGYAG